MFLKNITKKDVKLRSFEGYVFLLPPGVFAIWEPAGEHLLKVYKVESKGGKDKYGFDNGNGVPAILPSTEAEWKKGGRLLAQVTRFQIKPGLIPRASLIKTAFKRGVSADRTTEYQLDQQIDNETIISEINALPVPDEIRYPVRLDDETNE